MDVTIPMAFAAGVLSFLSPCVLPLVPAYISYISGMSAEELADTGGSKGIGRTGLRSLFFVLGFSVVFIALGATATTLGQILSAKLDILMKVAAIVIIVLGLHMVGAFRIRALYSEKRFHLRLRNGGPLGAFLIGIMFAFGWTPCIGPVLAGILGLAGRSETVLRGTGLLAIYSLGLGIPFIFTGFATGTALTTWSRLKKHFRKVEVASGVLLIAVGIVVFFGEMQSISSILQRWLPDLSIRFG